VSWDKEIDEMAHRERLAEELGGVEKVTRQHEFGKLTIRERISLISDEKSFQEIGKLAGVSKYNDSGELQSFMPSNFVFGTAEIDGRPVIISGDDFTVRGGSADASISGKRLQAEGLANELRLPHIRLIDGMGGGGSVKTIEMSGRTYIPRVGGWETIISHLGLAPSVSLALGSVAGIGAARVATSHYSVIVKDTAQMMIAGPALVDWASLGEVSKEELGSSDIHTRNGAIDDEAFSEEEAFMKARRFLSYLPTNVDEIPARLACNDPTERSESFLRKVIPKDPRKVYKMRPIIDAITDDQSFFEIGKKWGKSVITGLARLDGIPIALFAEDPMVYGGAWTSNSCRKLIRFCDLASTFHLPILHLVDCPGFLIGKQSEETATIRFGSQALAALGQANVPFCSVIIRKAFGVAGAANAKPGSHHFRFAWPSGDWGSLPIEGGIEVAYKAELAESEDYDLRLAEIKERLNRLRSPFRSAEYFEIEQVINPEETRKNICHWANLAYKAIRPGAYNFTYRP
tara:strand:+ start:2196 stop:3746 length:1551 start_codon:yes stop_codon:yes gene_type:complete